MAAANALVIVESPTKAKTNSHIIITIASLSASFLSTVSPAASGKPTILWCWRVIWGCLMPLRGPIKSHTEL